jgi:hypothetical protein
MKTVKSKIIQKRLFRLKSQGIKVKSLKEKFKLKISLKTEFK